MMKMNMPTEDAQDCMRELGERSMGNWFENMDKMDIQAERRNTAEARKELAEAREMLAEAKEMLLESENQLVDTQSALSEDESELSNTKNRLLDAAISIINMTKKYSGIRESAVSEVEKAIGVSKEEAEHLVEKYW